MSTPEDTLDTIESCYHYLRGVFADFKNKEPNTALLLLYNKARRCEQLEIDLKIEQKKLLDLIEHYQLAETKTTIFKNAPG